MVIEWKELPPIGTNAYALLDTDRGECAILDAPAEAHAWARELAEARGCRITALVLTHGHWDHTLDAHLFASDGVPVYGHEADRVLFESPERMADFALPGVALKPVAVDEWVGEGDTLDLIGRVAEVRHVPGHCPGNILLHFPSEKAAFVGDVIFAGGVGRYDLPGGNVAELEASIRNKVYTLPEATLLHPGHGPVTTVAREMAENPFVRA